MAAWDLPGRARTDLLRETRRGYVNEEGSKGELRRNERDSARNIGAYGQMQWTWHPEWSATAGLRFSKIRFAIDDRYITAASSSRGTGSQPLRSMRRMLPAFIDAPAMPACYLYVLPLLGEDIAKLGISVDPLARVRAFSRRYYECFDLERSSLVGFDSVAEARRAETALHRRWTYRVVPRRVRTAAGRMRTGARARPSSPPAGRGLVEATVAAGADAAVRMGRSLPARPVGRPRRPGDR